MCLMKCGGLVFQVLARSRLGRGLCEATSISSTANYILHNSLIGSRCSQPADCQRSRGCVPWGAELFSCCDHEKRRSDILLYGSPVVSSWRFRLEILVNVSYVIGGRLFVLV